MKVSAVLITREKEWPKDAILDYPFDEIIIKTECPDVYTRYQTAKTARSEVIYVQDDDVTTDIKSLVMSYNNKITNAIDTWHALQYKGTGMTLVGYGTFFPKSMLDFSKYTDVYGENELFKMEADRVFTYLNRPFHSVRVPFRNLPRSFERNRMSSQKNHWDNLQIIKKQLWQLDK